MSALRRFEILLPQRFNNGQQIPDSVLGRTLQDLEARFGAVSWETQLIRGRGHHELQVYEDDSMRVILDVPDTQENRLKKTASFSASSRSD